MIYKTFAAFAFMALLLAFAKEAQANTRVEAETMRVVSGGTVVNNLAASGGKALRIANKGRAIKVVTTSVPVDRIHLRGVKPKVVSYCGVTTELLTRKRVDGVWQRAVSHGRAEYIAGEGWTTRTFGVNLDPGKYIVIIRHLCDSRVLYDYFELQTAAVEPAPVSSNPFAGEAFLANHYNAKRQADEWRSTRPEDAKQMDKLARNPVVQFYSEWANEHHVNNNVTQATNAGKLPMLGIYAIPNRDCGHYSGGGWSSPEQYKAWIDKISLGIGTRKAVVILEPDAVAGWGCLSEAMKKDRQELLRYAVTKLKSNPKTYVYIDAGHPHWHSAEETASRLKLSGIDKADGFTLNHSNFHPTSENVAYGKKISALVGGKHFIVDTSRNGLGATTGFEYWCNPQGRALGVEPTANTGEPLVDAFFWLKTPGQSDGACKGYPGGGAWLPEYALGLAQRASY